MRRLSKDLESALERARRESTRRGHTHVKVEHVVRALLDEGHSPSTTLHAPAVLRAHAAGLSVPMLVAAADDELARLPAVHSYRDAVNPLRNDDELEAILGRVRRGWRAILGLADGGAFLDAFFATPRGAEWIELCAIDSRPLRDLLARVRAIQARWGGPITSAEHEWSDTELACGPWPQSSCVPSSGRRRRPFGEDTRTSA